jgi:hypothetical protein
MRFAWRLSSPHLPLKEFQEFLIDGVRVRRTQTMRGASDYLQNPVLNDCFQILSLIRFRECLDANEPLP